MQTPLRITGTVALIAACLTTAPNAEAPYLYAIKGARIVTAAGPPIANGTLVIRSGLIDAIGSEIAVPPAAVVIEANGLSVYPGLIDMGNSTGLDVPTDQQRPEGLRTLEQVERWKRTQIFRPELLASERLRADSPELARLASFGITSVLASPPGSLVRGQSALVNVVGPIDEPQIGNVGDYRRGLQIVRSPVLLHVDFGGSVGGDGYPASLLGAIAFVRQSFLDAQYQQLAVQRYERVKTEGVGRPSFDPSLDALLPALGGKLPVAFEADLAREILRALDMAQEFKLDPVITSGREADQVSAELKARNARVIYSLNFPTRSRLLSPDADEPLRELRTRAQAPRVPAALDKSGIPFAFASAGLREQQDFLRNAARAVKEGGLPADVAVRALTIGAARIAGAADRVGSIERGKIANVIVTEGDLFDEKMRLRHVFVDGRPVTIEERQPEQRRGRSNRP
jgi:imidazolonepropionase-like amidohydrolase